MMEFARPNVLWALLALPPVAFWIALGVRRSRAELTRFVGHGLADTLAPGYSWRKHLLKGALKTLALTMMIVALAGPRFGSQLVKVDREGIDIVVALDTSLSMLAEDMLPNRLERAKQAIVDLIKGLQGDRVGMVVFAGDAYALCPLTVDYDAALMFARTVDVDMVSEPGTAIDKAISISAALFDESEKRDRAIVVVTDGENHEGDALGEAQRAGERGIRIFTIGIGNPAGELIPERAADGTVAGYKKDRRGETVLTRLDEKTLQEVAAAADGKYLPATREGLELRVLYNEISGMDRKAIQGEFVERRKERFWIFLAAALALLLIDTLVSSRATGMRRRARRYLHTGAPLLLVALTLTAATPAVAKKKVDRGKVEAGNEYYRAAEYDKARTLYHEALGDTMRLPENYQGVFYNEANALYMQEDYQRAIDVYQRSYSPDTTLTGQMLYNRGNALLRSGKLPEAIESYVQALTYLPDDVDARHNLELALKMLQQQEQEQQQQQQQDQQNEKNQDSEQEQQNQQEQQQQEGEQQDQQEQQGEQDRRQEQEPDSTQTPEPQPADSTAVQQPQLSPEEMMQLSREDAMRILQALEEQEKKLQEERRRAAFRRLKKSGKDW